MLAGAPGRLGLCISRPAKGLAQPRAHSARWWWDRLNEERRRMIEEMRGDIGEIVLVERMWD